MSDLDRGAPFSYRCGGCGRCCLSRSVPLTPYEVVRLARRKRISTTEFVARYTVRDGAFLAHAGENEGCALLDGSRCSVHEDRPLACRLYPLGRLETTAPEPSETFHLLEPEPETEGVYGEKGTVGDFLEAQGVEPFLAARALYAELLDEIEAALASPGTGAGERRELPDDLLDVDPVVAAHRRRHGLPVPDGPEALMAMHVEAVREVLGSSPVSAVAARRRAGLRKCRP